MAFDLFENVSYTNKPWHIGMRRSIILYENMLWRNGEPLSAPPSEASMSFWTDTLSAVNYKGPLILDVEHWPIYTKPVERNYMVQIATRFKQDAQYQVGYYAMIPKRNVSDALEPWGPGFLKWKTENTFVQSIADSVDILFPSLYTLYGDEYRWKQYAVQNIMEARRLAPNKKVYAMIWPQYHTGVVGATPLAYIDEDFWYEQLTFVKQLCDGAIIWGVDTSPWTTDMPWYRATLGFINKYNLVRSY